MKVRSKRLKQRALSRRQTLQLLGGVAAVAPLAALWGCADAAAAASGDDAGASGKAGAGGRGGAAAGGQGGSGGSAANPGGWASGGTAAMTAANTYQNPFEDDEPDACQLTCQLTKGPCHDDQATEREDVSEGQVGLPMRFGLRILDADCQPVTDADVDIWHCDTAGVYSSATADNPSFCTGNHPDALKARYFRGHRKTDTGGVAWFSSCFPGWYSGRAVHVHFTVRRSSRDGDEYLTSQVAFASELTQEICTTHPDYSAHGKPNTSNTSDTVFRSDSVADYVMNTQRTSDGALLAWKTVIIRSSLSDSACGASGSGS
jgi:protocatechuate 3,4-dioxygenase beta subunit